ncbi:unnamed protein product [Acanthoscelides obtectus]|uniref:Uncharacterized protein n=1 Tax=Acanthoscelides obtectus TaxID=200917 RepID=A0A9P0M8W5_ACAOB|nr:unnamed protein product [Acanthoscelides obtectus]CAK1629886.1 hypothetical protein AOBTE_LOCUS6016 [Acanthoscelides obtectus]
MACQQRKCTSKAMFAEDTSYIYNPRLAKSSLGDKNERMPFNYRKKQTTRKRSNLDLSVIKNALGDIDQGKSIRGVALEYGIDRNTLRNYLRDRSKLTKISEQGSQFKTSMIFTIEEEKALVE